MAAVRGVPNVISGRLRGMAYSVFTMAHGRSKEECDAILDSIADQHGLHDEDRAVLYTLDRVSRRSPPLLN